MTSASPGRSRPLPFSVRTTAGVIPVLAITRALAIQAALELAGPGAALVGIEAEGDW